MITPGVDLKYPVHALKCYVDRNGVGNQDSSRPVFTPLNFPFSALSAASIANILCTAITWAGLDGQGYTAKSFCPTGTTVAVQNGVDPDRVQQIRCWKNQECFQKHYVHTKPESSTSDLILSQTL